MAAAKQRVRRRPISLAQLHTDAETAEKNQSNLTNPMFSIQSLRQPYHMLDALTKKQLNQTIETHKKIDEVFLDRKIVPRMVIFMEDGTSLKKNQSDKQDEKHEVAIFTKRGPNNVAININKYIAKYDFDIAMKLKKDETDKEKMERENDAVKELDLNDG